MLEPRKHMLFQYLDSEQYVVTEFGNDLLLLGYDGMVLSNNYVVKNKVRFVVNTLYNKSEFFDKFFESSLYSFFNLTKKDTHLFVSEWVQQKFNELCQEKKK
jgi:hypothetical protein